MRSFVVQLKLFAAIIKLATRTGSVSAQMSVNVAPGRYLIELNKDTKATVAEASTSFVSAAEELGISVIVQRHFDDCPFQGLSVIVNGKQDVDVKLLEDLPFVSEVFPVLLKDIPTPVRSAANAAINALQMIGASDAHSELNATGKGVKVGIIDTGIDYTHPDLGACFGKGCRVAWGYDFVGDMYNANNPLAYPIPDNDPLDCHGHGTHVAGIVGASGSIVGVAPGVQLGAYKIFGCSGATDDTNIIAAICRAVQDGMQVINLSLGAPGGWPHDAVAHVLSKVVDSGVVVATSNGNSGEGGIFTTGSLSSTAKGLGVASFSNVAISALTGFLISPVLRTFAYLDGVPASPFELGFRGTLVPTGTPASGDDACRQLTPGSLVGVVALIRRGACPFATKVDNAAAAGALGVVIYNTASGPVTPAAAGGWSIPLVAVSRGVGEALHAFYVDGRTVEIAFPENPTPTAVPNPTGGQVSTFSSQGPTYDLDVKPDLGAPGGLIFSTWPLNKQSTTPGYAVLSGTSMSSPMVAGAAALLLQAYGYDANRVNSVLSMTSQPQLDAAFLGSYAGVYAQGAGLINVYYALLSGNKVSLSARKLALGDGYNAKTVPLTITNHQQATVLYTFTHVPAVSEGIYLPAAFINVAGGRMQAKTDKAATVVLDPDEVTLEAGESATISVVVTPPAEVLPLSAYGGYILVDFPDSPRLVVPYLGLAGRYQSMPVLSPGNPITFRKCLKIPVSTCTLAQPGVTFKRGSSYPAIDISLLFGVESVFTELISEQEQNATFAVQVLGAYLVGGYSYRFPVSLSPLDGALGLFRIRLTVLKPLGDLNNPRDLIVYNTVAFEVVG